MNTKHTPEPWESTESCRVIAPLRHVICSDVQGRTLAESHANAMRIVACVNACAGLSDADLATLRATDGADTAQGIDIALSLRQERVELLAALQRLLNPNYDYALRHGQFWAMEAKSEARAALARARGTV